MQADKIFKDSTRKLAVKRRLLDTSFAAHKDNLTSFCPVLSVFVVGQLAGQLSRDCGVLQQLMCGIQHEEPLLQLDQVPT